MRTTSLLLLCVFCVAPLSVRAGDDADALTARVPKESEIILRLPSLDRVDALGKEVLPLLKSVAGDEAASMLEKGKPSEMLLGMLGIDPALIDRTRPVYFGRAGRLPVAFVHAAEGATLESELVLANGMTVQLTDGILCVGPPGLTAEGARGTPTALLGGDIAVHVFLQEVVDKNKETIEATLGMVTQMAGMVPLPQALAKLIPTVLDGARGGIYGVQGLDYALTWKGEMVESEGRLTTRAESGIRKLFSRAGAAGDTGLAAYLTRDAMITADFTLTPDWPDKEIADFLAKAMGEDAGKAIMQMLGPTHAFQNVLTGQGAVSVTPAPMGMGATTEQLLVLKADVDMKAFFDQFNVEAVNKASLEAGMPMTYEYEKAVAMHGETALHRLSVVATDPMFAMAAMVQTYFASEGGHLFIVSSATAEDDIKKLIDRVRKGEPGAHPHLEAMARLGRKRNIGFTFNLGKIKQVLGVLAMLNPELGAAMNKLPDELYLSTAISFHDGNLHWRGDWPIKKIAEIAAAFGEEEGEAAPPPDEDFD